MKKFIFCLLSFCVVVLSPAFSAEKIVWTGDEPISWNPDVYAGSEFETAEDLFAGLAQGDTIKVSVVAHLDEPQYVITYKAGSDWSWTNLADITVADGLMSYIVENETIANEIATRGLVFRGQGYNITQIAFTYVEEKPVDPDPDPDPDPEMDSVKVVWSGDTAISWNTEEYAGVQLETKNTECSFVGLKKDWYLVFHVSNVEENALYELCKGDWSSMVGGELAQDDTTFVFQVTDEALVEDIIANGMVIKGIRFHLTAIIISVTDPTVKPDPDPDPEDPQVYVERTVWTGDIAISWNQEVYPGTEFVTIDSLQDMFAGLQEKDSIKIFYTDAIDEAQFALSYRDEDWNYKDLTVSEKEGFFAYKVASEEMAEAIADRGLVIRGQGYHAVRIVIGTPEQTEGVEEIVNRQSSNRKYIKDGQLVIIREEKEYSILGQIIK